MKIDDAIRTFQLIPPVDPSLAESRDLAARPTSLSGLRMALLDNRKGNANILLTEIGHRMSQQYGLSETRLFTKPIFSRPSPHDLLRRVGEYDIVATAIGD